MLKVINTSRMRSITIIGLLVVAICAITEAEDLHQGWDSSKVEASLTRVARDINDGDTYGGSSDARMKRGANPEEDVVEESLIAEETAGIDDAVEEPMIAEETAGIDDAVEEPMIADVIEEEEDAVVEEGMVAQETAGIDDAVEEPMIADVIEEEDAVVEEGMVAQENAEIDADADVIDEAGGDDKTCKQRNEDGECVAPNAGKGKGKGKAGDSGNSWWSWLTG